jgi:predicted RNA binding protein YcfA (HicA-like mRNA interferase family)
MGKQVTSREAIKEIEARGWYLERIKGDHFNYKHPNHPLLITITHPVRSLSPGLIRDIERKAGFRF